MFSQKLQGMDKREVTTGEVFKRLKVNIIMLSNPLRTINLVDSASSEDIDDASLNSWQNLRIQSTVCARKFIQCGRHR